MPKLLYVQLRYPHNRSQEGNKAFYIFKWTFLSNMAEYYKVLICQMPDYYIHDQIHMYIIMSSFVSGICVGKYGHGMDNYLLIGILVHIMMCQYTIIN